MEFCIILFLIFCGPIFAVDDNDTSNSSNNTIEVENIALPVLDKVPNGLTVKEAKDFLFELRKLEKWSDDTVCCTSFIIAGISFTVGIAGSVIAGIFCADSGVDIECQNHCNLGYQGLGWCNLSKKCFLSNDICLSSCSYYNPTPNDPLCISGAVMVAFPFICVGLAACSGLFNKLRNKLLDRSNKKLQSQIHRSFLEREDNDVLIDEEMFAIGPLLMASKSELLKRLSESQMLLLASMNLVMFRRLLEDNFADDVKVTAQKLLRLLDMDVETLADTLSQKNVRQVLKKNPPILQALLHTLPHDALDHPEIRKCLKKILKSILSLPMENTDSLDEALDHISEGISIDSYFPRRIVTESQKIELLAGNQKFIFDKVSLGRVSTKMRELCEDCEVDEPLILESTVKPAWVLMVQNLSQGNKPKLDEKNILEILDAAHYFDIKKIVEECDKFLLNNGITNLLICRWQKEYNLDQDKFTFQRKWLFCDRYGLVRNKHVLAKKFLKKLVLITPTAKDLPILQNLTLLNHAFIKDREDIDCFDKFTAKFHQPEFLTWVWANGKNAEIVRYAVVKFCLNPINKNVVESAFVALPSDLEKTIASYKQ